MDLIPVWHERTYDSKMLPKDSGDCPVQRQVLLLSHFRYFGKSSEMFTEWSSTKHIFFVQTVVMATEWRHLLNIWKTYTPQQLYGWSNWNFSEALFIALASAKTLFLFVCFLFVCLFVCFCRCLCTLVAIAVWLQVFWHYALFLEMLSSPPPSIIMLYKFLILICCHDNLKSKTLN